jgi:hypothetical protein
MNVKKPTLTFEQINELIAYDGATGVFTWKKTASRRHKVGEEIGEFKSRVDKYGVARRYKYIGVLYHQTPATRIAWLLTYGEWPKGNILYKDGNTENLKIDNLKEADFPTVITVKGSVRHYKMSAEATRHYGLKRYYGMSGETYNMMLAAQGGVCAICKGTETYIAKGYNEPKALSVDHNHETGAIRGLLCSNCNYMIGHCRENPDILLDGAKYLRLHNGTPPAKPKLEIVRTDAPTEDAK